MNEQEQEKPAEKKAQQINISKAMGDTMGLLPWFHLS